MANILLIIPAYNESGNLALLADRIRRVREFDFDVIVVNDCSTDNTAEICAALGIPVIDLPVNLGIGGAVQTGYRYALRKGYDYAVQVDGDGQHRPEDIAKLLGPLLDDSADMTIGSRFIAEGDYKSTFARRIGIRYFSFLLYSLTRQRVTDPTSGFRACNAKVIALFADRYPVDYPEPESIMVLKRMGLRIREVPVAMQERGEGKSSIRSLRSVYYMTKVSLAILIDKMRKQTV